MGLQGSLKILGLAENHPLFIDPYTRRETNFRDKWMIIHAGRGILDIIRLQICPSYAKGVVELLLMEKLCHFT
jgi:hypothetical protein